jgi:RNA polymerase sigma-70 factor (ECF subfamily)
MQAVTLIGTRDDDRDAAVTEVIAAVVPRLYRFARYRLSEEDAKDAVAIALEHLWRNRRKLPEENLESIERWVMRVAINRMLDEVRRYRRRPVELDLADLDLPNEDSVPRERRMADIAQLRVCLRRLPERDANLIGLRFGAGLSNPEIAELRNMTSGAVAVAVHRALARLRQEMNQES